MRWAALTLALAGVALAGCGVGRSPAGGGAHQTRFDNAFVAAKVNGRPIYVEDVRTYAVENRMLPDGQELDPASDVYHLALNDLITQRLFALEAESRGLDRDPEVRRELEKTRERTLANAVFRELDTRANDPSTIERLYRENTKQLGDTQEVQLRHIQFDTREAALAAKRRLDEGGPENTFQRLAFELSRDRETASEGGELGWKAVDNLADGIRQAVDSGRVGSVVGPVQSAVGWHLVEILDRRRRGVPSLAALRPRIIDWLRFEETNRLRERLESTARIELAVEPASGVPPAGEVTVPADRPAETPQIAVAPPPQPQQQPRTEAPAPSALASTPAPTPAAASASASPPRASRDRPEFPFPMGPGGIAGAAAQQPAPESSSQAGRGQ